MVAGKKIVNYIAQMHTTIKMHKNFRKQTKNKWENRNRESK